MSNFDQIGQFGISIDPSPVPRGIPNFNSATVFGRTSHIKWASTLLCLSATASVILRLFSRRRFDTKLWWDDGCAFLAVLLLLVNQVLFIKLEWLGRTSFAFLALMDPEQEQLRLARVVDGLKVSLGYEGVYLVAVWAVKFSMLFLYARFAKHTRIITLYLRITQGLCAIAFTICFFALFLGCRPLSLYWDITSTLCTRRAALTYASGISNIITNTLVLAVPVPLLLRASLTQRQLTGVAVLYFFGLFVITASALRFVTQLLNVSVPQAVGWSQIEVALAIVLSCIPMVAKLLLTPLEQPARVGEGVVVGELVKKLETESRKRREMDRVLREGNRGRSSWLGGLRESWRGSSVAGGYGSSRWSRRLSFMTRGSVRSFGTTAAVTAGQKVEFTGTGAVDFQKLRVVRAEVNGVSIWEVRPITPGTPKTGWDKYPVV